MRFYERLEPAVFVLRLVPGMRADIIPLLAPHYRALVLESFGVGGLPGGEHGEMFAALRRWCESGRLAVFTTQVPHEGCDLAVYEVGRAVGGAARRPGGPRHDPRGCRRQADVGAGPDRGPGEGGAAV